MTETAVPHRDALPDAVFRQQWRDWIAVHYVSALRGPLQRLVGVEARAWLAAQHRDGWRAPGLARAHGGMGLSLRKQWIYQQELERFAAARPMDMGLRLLAPVLLRYGSVEQQAQLLPRILSAEDTWCQGYSEPGAGSDLASLRTAAVAHGDGFLVNGQKTWTTMADDSDWIFLLVRTGTGGRKQDGLSFMLADMRSPGITVRPIRTLAGNTHFCEVFFDDVFVPRTGLVGEPGAGWSIGRTLLGFERLSHGSPEVLRYAFDVLQRTCASLPPEEAMRAMPTMERHACDMADATALYDDVCATAAAGGDTAAAFSVLKLFNAETSQRIAETAHELVGQWGGVQGIPVESGLGDDLEWLYMVTRPLTIFGGTSQIQRNLIATGALGLPRA